MLEVQWAAINGIQDKVNAPRRFCCVFAGNGKVAPTMSCSSTVKLLILTCTLSQWAAWIKQLSRNSQFGPAGWELYFIWAKPYHTHLECLSEAWLRGSHTTIEIQYRPIYSGIGLAPSDYSLFLSMTNDLDGEQLALRKACQNRCFQLFPYRNKKPSKWQKALGSCMRKYGGFQGRISLMLNSRWESGVQYSEHTGLKDGTPHQSAECQWNWSTRY